MPRRFTCSDRIQNFAKEKSQEIISKGKADPTQLLTTLGFENITITSVDETDGLRIKLIDGSIVHLRPSGNAPELRCYAEADNYSQAHNCVANSLNKLQEL